MNRRSARWQELMRINLELQLIAVAAPTRARRTPVLFTGGGCSWLSLLPAASRGKPRLH